MKTLDEKSNIGMRVGIVGVIVNILLSVGKITAGLISNSQAVLGDGINSLSDSISSVITVASFWIMGKPADKEHPYGHQRFEYIAGFVMTLIMAYLGFDIVQSSIRNILNPVELNISTMTMVILLGTIFIKVALVAFYTKKGNAIDSDILKAAALDSKNDIIMTISILLSVGVQLYFKVNFDGYVGVLVGLYILFETFKMVRDFVDELMGIRPRQETLDKIKGVLENQGYVVGYHDLMIHYYGKDTAFGTVHVEVSDKLSLIKAHDIMHEIETEIKQATGVDLVVHIDPLNLEDTELQRIYQFIKELLKTKYPTTSFHDLQVIKGTLAFDVVLNAETRTNQIVEDVQGYLDQHEIDYVLDITFDQQQLI